MNPNHVKILTRRLIPCPESIDFSDGAEYYLCDQCPITVEVSTKTGIRQKITALCRMYWNIKPVLTLKVSAAAKKCGSEAYQLNVTEKQLKITAGDWRGIANAFKTLRQLAEPLRGTERVSGYLLVPCRIKDSPAVSFRGMHFCIFPETPLWDIEKQIRLAAYYKFNYAVIECWGNFPFESHPEIGWAESRLDRKELKHLIQLGKELGITLIPQFNLLGHASGARVNSGKHSVLDFNPSMQPLFEPEGWSWCISNPAVRNILSDLVLELYDFFEHPPFFHIGCDEAHDAGGCFECRKHELKDLIRDHILYFHDLFQQRNTRIIMWHDMLLERTDERWNGYIALAEPEQNLKTLYQELPKDIVIADWQYWYNGEGEPEFPTVTFFRKEFSDVLVCPWLEPGIISGLGKTAAKKKLFGFLQTTWNISHDANHWAAHCLSACAAWNPERIPEYDAVSFPAAALHYRQVGWDMNLSGYEKTGWIRHQVSGGDHPHKEN